MYAHDGNSKSGFKIKHLKTFFFSSKPPTYGHELACHQFESAVLESLDDFTNKSPLDAVRFDGDESFLSRNVSSGGGHVDVGVVVVVDDVAVAEVVGGVTPSVGR